MKTCTKCKQLKSLADFGDDKRHPDLKQSWCRLCGYTAKKIKRTNNKRKAVDYLGGKCQMCGITSECLDIFDFHHRDPEEKEYSLNLLVNKTWDHMKPELDKCDLLCSNCHKITHWKLRNTQ